MAAGVFAIWPGLFLTGGDGAGTNPVFPLRKPGFPGKAAHPASGPNDRARFVRIQRAALSGVLGGRGIPEARKGQDHFPGHQQPGHRGNKGEASRCRSFSFLRHVSLFLLPKNRFFS